MVIEAMRTGIETIGQEYIVARMSWIKEVAVEEEKPEEEK